MFSLLLLIAVLESVLLTQYLGAPLSQHLLESSSRKRNTDYKIKKITETKKTSETNIQKTMCPLLHGQILFT